MMAKRGTLFSFNFQRASRLRQSILLRAFTGELCKEATSR